MEFGVLGSLALWRPQAPQDLTAPRLRALLAVLLLAEAPVPHDRLRELLLGPTVHSSGSVHVAVHRLRRWLDTNGGHRILSGADGYRLDVAPELIDAGHFRRLIRQSSIESLASALSLWRGQAVADAPAAVRNMHAVRRLDQARRDTTVELAETCLATGSPERALPLVLETAAASPYDERMQGVLAVTLAACGCRVEALRLLARQRRILADEFGVDPGPHLREAQSRILRPDLGGRSYATFTDGDRP